MKVKDKSIANLLARHGMPPVVAEAFNGMVTAKTDPLTGGIELSAGGQDVLAASGNGRFTDRKQFAGRVVADFGTLSGYNTVGGTMSLVATPPGGTSRRKTKQGNSIRFTGASSNIELEFPAFTAGNATNRVDLWIYVEDYTQLANGLTLFLAQEVAYTNYFIRSVSIPQHNGWHCLSYTTQNLQVGAGAPTLGTITRGKIRINNPGAGGAALTVDRMVFEGGGTPYVCLLWDDGSGSDYSYVMPLLNKHRLIGNFGIIGSLIGDNPGAVLSHTQLKQMAESGQRLVTHGQSALSSLPSMDAVKADIQANKAYLDSLGVDVDSDVYVYPNGVYLYAAGDLSIPQYLQGAGFAGAFKVGGDFVSNESTIERFYAPRKTLNATTVAATWLAQLDQHVAAGLSVAAMGHTVVASGATGDQINASVLDEILAGIADRRNQGKLFVVPAKDWLSLAMIG